MTRIITAPCLALVLLSCIAFAQVAPAPAAQDPVLVTISEKTTRITEPLKPSGYPDYLEALNIAARGKVTPATNGAVLLVRAAGAYGVSAGIQQDEFYNRLGIEPLPENARRHVFSIEFVSDIKEPDLPPPNEEEKKLEEESDRFLARRDRVELDFDHCSEHPWTAKEYPLVARWLTEQKKSLAQLDRLGEYPDAYMPHITGERDGSIIASEIPFIQITRNFARDLMIRAMHSLGEGKIDAAIDDLERLLLLSGYQEKHKNLLSQLICFALRGLTHSLVNELVLSTKLDAKQLDRIKQLIEKHYPENKTTFVECMDQGERQIMLESICRYAEFGPGADEQKPMPLKTRQNLDYDLMLSIGNAHYDRLADIARIEDSAKQAEAFSDLEKELSESSKQIKSIGNGLLNLVSKAKRSQQVMVILKALLTPALSAAMQAGVKDSLRRDLWLLSIALEQYRRKHERFPKSLEELTPQFLAKVPVDRFTGKALKYATDGRGVLVYSVGRDLEDHGGFEGFDTDRYDCDDIAIFTNDHRPKQPASKPPRDFFD